MPHFKCQTELFHSTNLPSLCRRLFSIGLFVPYCTNLFKNVHLSVKGQEHPHRQWAPLLFSYSKRMNRLLLHLVCCTAKSFPTVILPLMDFEPSWDTAGNTLYYPTWPCTPPTICPSICLRWITLPSLLTETGSSVQE